jgi:1-deoxy-D-xylulose-5-phosphate reductoisomerase
MVEYRDGAVLAQLGLPDMRLPIQYALTWPERLSSPVKAPVYDALQPLTFAGPDTETFRCLALARKAAGVKGISCAVLNAANEVAVEQFLHGEIGFLDIEARVERALREVRNRTSPTLEDILAADEEARALTAAI